jgi:hypothetical protein
MVTRRQWLMRVGGGVVLAGWSDVDLTAADLPPGVYEPSREHLGHALAGHPVAAGGETELVQVRGPAFQPAFFQRDQFRTLVQLAAILLGEPPDAPIVHEIAGWIDLTVSESAAVRAAARALSPANRTLAMHHYGAASVRKLEDFDAQKICREGLTWLDAESHRAGGFLSLDGPSQAGLLKSVSDTRPEPRSENAGTHFFTYLKERVIDGFYTSRAGLDELGYRGNAFYASPPGCEHLYG